MDSEAQELKAIEVLKENQKNWARQTMLMNRAMQQFQSHPTDLFGWGGKFFGGDLH